MAISLNIKKLFNSSPKKVGKKSNISISKNPSKPKNILILFPLNEDFFRAASYAYRNLPYSKRQISFHYIVNDDFTDFFSLRRGTIHKFLLNAKNKIINKDILIKELKKYNFDIIIDLNINYQPELIDFINKESNYKIGFQHKYSDELYNVQVSISKSSIAEKGFQKILELI